MEPRDTLLLVDDQQADRAVLRELFQEEYNLLEAENGEQAAHPRAVQDRRGGKLRPLLRKGRLHLWQPDKRF